MCDSQCRCISAFFILGNRLRLCGDIIMKIGPDIFLVVNLFDNFSGFFDGFNDEMDLIVEVVGLLDLDLD